jgi:hypothetical protein
MVRVGAGQIAYQRNNQIATNMSDASQLFEMVGAIQIPESTHASTKTNDPNRVISTAVKAQHRRPNQAHLQQHCSGTRPQGKAPSSTGRPTVNYLQLTAEPACTNPALPMRSMWPADPVERAPEIQEIGSAASICPGMGGISMPSIVSRGQ